MQEVVAQVCTVTSVLCEFCRKERETSGQPADNLSLETEQKKTFLLLLLLFLLLTNIHTYIHRSDGLGHSNTGTALSIHAPSCTRPAHNGLGLLRDRFIRRLENG